MKKLLCVCVLAAAMFLTAGTPSPQAAVNTQPNAPGNPLGQLTGKLWMESHALEKQAFLFGIESAIAVEYYVNDELAKRAQKNGKKKQPACTLSPFEKGWMKAFGDNVENNDIIAEIDQWYAAHPDKMDRPVMAVIWYELIEPRLRKKAN